MQMDVSGEDGAPPINKNMPHVAGALKWSNELRDRITKPMQALKLSVNHGWVDNVLMNWACFICKFLQSSAIIQISRFSTLSEFHCPVDVWISQGQVLIPTPYTLTCYRCKRTLWTGDWSLWIPSAFKFYYGGLHSFGQIGGLNCFSEKMSACFSFQIVHVDCKFCTLYYKLRTGSWIVCSCGQSNWYFNLVFRILETAEAMIIFNKYDEMKKLLNE